MEPVPNVELNGQLLTELYDVVLRGHFSYVDSQMGLKRSLKLEPVEIHQDQHDNNELEFDVKIEEIDAIDLKPKQEPCDKFYLAPIDHEVSARLCYPCFTCQYNPYTYPTRRQKRLEQVHKTCDPVLQ